MTATKKRLSDEQKLAILKEHLVDKVPIADLCKKHGIVPSGYYLWQKQLFEGVFGTSSPKLEQLPQLTKAQKRIKQLEQKVQKKDEILGEMMEDYIRLKKNIFGES
jgi:transposase-like protein